jgi:hypothetical protein
LTRGALILPAAGEDRKARAGSGGSVSDNPGSLNRSMQLLTPYLGGCMRRHMVADTPNSFDKLEEFLKTKKRRMLVAIFLVATSTIVVLFDKWLLREPGFDWFAASFVTLSVFVALVVLVRPNWARRAITALQNEEERAQKRLDNWQPPGFP